MMKRVFGLMLGLLVVLLACACFAEEHVCTPAFTLFMDDKESWDECRCGERLNVREHQWVEGNMGDDCAVCGAWLRKRGEAVQVTLSNEDYQTIRYYARGEDGSIIMRHDADNGDTLLQIQVFSIGDQVITEREEYEYLEDGSYRSRQFRDGVLLFESLFVYEEMDGYRSYYPAERKVFLNDGGWVIQKSSSSAGVDEEIFYDAAGVKRYTITSEREINSEGNEVVTQYKDGVLFRVYEYAAADMGEYMYYYIAKETVYDEKGNATVTKRDQDGNVIE